MNSINMTKLLAPSNLSLISFKVKEVCPIHCSTIEAFILFGLDPGLICHDVGSYGYLCLPSNCDSAAQDLESILDGTGWLVSHRQVGMDASKQKLLLDMPSAKQNAYEGSRGGSVNSIFLRLVECGWTTHTPLHISCSKKAVQRKSHVEA
jgi:hypothetical protein